MIGKAVRLSDRRLTADSIASISTHLKIVFRHLAHSLLLGNMLENS